MGLRGCVAIGVCHLMTVQKQRFFRCWQFGSGTYSLFMNTLGAVKSNHHSDKRFSDAFVKVMILCQIRAGNSKKVT